jgi:septal ring factor EnvC (AmiA/AmiB activator)
MKEQMEADYKAASEKEAASAAAFADMRTAKTAAIEAGEAMAEQKEDELAKTDNLVAEAKEDLGQTEETLAADEEFLNNLDKMCADSDSAFEKRKASRLEVIKAVSETIEILTGDEARDAMSGTYNFLQVSSSDKNRKVAAALLRKVGLKTHNIDISFLANKVELDAFTKVKKAIDDMIATLKTEQADEVKKNDYCTQELQSTEMTIAKADDLKADLQAKIGSLESQEATLADEIEADKAAIAQGQMDLQRASEDRQRENLDFQKTIADQTMTIEILMKAMERLAQFYDAQLIQVRKQTPPVAQAEYKPNAGASGIMSMIEKLIYDAKDLVGASKKAESEAQAAYEQLTADTNQSQADLAQAVVEKTKAKAKAHKDKLGAESDLMDTVDELEGLHKYETDVHEECDYLLKNFMARQQARGEEIEGLQQAKQILDGANLR